MNSPFLSTAVSILRELFYLVAYLASGVAAYLTLQQPRVKQALAETTGLVKAVIFVAITAILHWPLSSIVSDTFAFLDALVDGRSALYSSVRCFGGVVLLAGLVVGIVMLMRNGQSDAEEIA